MRKQAFAVGLVFLILITLPYLYAAQAAGPDFVFGGFLLNPLDGNSYLAKMYQGWRGEWRFTLPYTAEPGQGAYLFLFYLFLGRLARWFNLPLLVVFYLARLCGAMALLSALYRFLAAQSMGGKGWVFTLAFFGSGMGWLVFPFGAFTSDFWVAEAYPFLSAYANPHFALGLALLLWLLPTWRASGTPGGSQTGMDRQAGWVTFVLALMLAIIAPFGVVVALAVMGGVWVWEFGQRVYGAQPATQGTLQALGRRMAWVLLGGGPALLYEFWAARSDPVLAVWNAQNLTTSPPVWDLLLSLSPALLLALGGAWFKREAVFGRAMPGQNTGPVQNTELVKTGAPAITAGANSNARLLLAWLGLGILLLYLPFGLQRRFMMGLFIPVALLAGYGLAGLAAKASRRVDLIAALALVFSLLTNVLVLLAARHGAQTHAPALYLTGGEAQAFEWIEAHTPPAALILCAPDTGLFIPAHTGRRVLYGHPYETANAQSEEEAVRQFFSGGIPDAAAFLQQRGVEYVFYGPREGALGALPEGLGLEAVYSAGGVTIYQAAGQ